MASQSPCPLRCQQHEVACRCRPISIRGSNNPGRRAIDCGRTPKWCLNRQCIASWRCNGSCLPEFQANMRGTKVQIPSINTTAIFKPSLRGPCRTKQIHNIHAPALKHRHVRMISVGRLSADEAIEEECTYVGINFCQPSSRKQVIPHRTSGGGLTHHDKFASPVRSLSQFPTIVLDVYWQAH